MSTIALTICPECGSEHPLDVSHKIGRYLCVEGRSPGGPHRFVIVTEGQDIVAEADTVEDATKAAVFLSAEQQRVLVAMELSVLAERRALAERFAKRERRLRREAAEELDRGRVDHSLIAEARADQMRDLAAEMSIAPVY